MHSVALASGANQRKYGMLLARRQKRKVQTVAEVMARAEAPKPRRSTAGDTQQGTKRRTPNRRTHAASEKPRLGRGFRYGSAGRIRTYDQSVNSRPLYH